MIEFAKSMAGHDRNHIYLVTGKDERFVYLADGNVKLLAEPKKKNRKHIQIIHRYRMRFWDVWNRKLPILR